MVALILLSLFLTPAPTNAGVWDYFRAFCRHHIVADDPYQFEKLSTPQVIAEYRKEGEKAVRADKQSQMLRILGEELRRRPVSQEAWNVVQEYSSYEESY